MTKNGTQGANLYAVLEGLTSLRVLLRWARFFLRNPVP